MPTVDLRFMIYGKDEIKQATGYMIELGAASKDRIVAHDKEGRAMKRAMIATKQQNKFYIELLKIRSDDLASGRLTAAQREEQFNNHMRMLDAEESRLKDYVQTDRVDIAQRKRKNKIINDSIKATVKYNNDTEKLRRTYDSTYAATKRYKQGLKDIDRAFEGMEDGPERASRAIKALKSDYQAFIAASKSGQLVDAGNQFARYGDQAYRAQQRTKRFASVGLQQAGYQVNDFIVQIASGQNALVAFGQQGSQLAGIFGTQGAVVGAVIAAVAALGNLAYQAYMAQEGIKTLEDALSDLGDALGMVADAEQTLEDLASGEYLGHMADEAERLADSLRALGLAKGLAEVVSGMKAVTDTDMGFLDEFIKGSIEKSKDLIPFYRMFATNFYRETQTLTEKMQDDQAQNMAASLFGKDSGKVGYTEAFLQDLRKLQEAKASAEEVAKRISTFTKQAEIWGFDDATTEGKALFDEIIRLGDGARKIAEAQADSVRQERDRRQAVEDSATEMEAFYKQIEKEDKQYWKRYYKNYKLQQKQEADRLKAGIAAAKRILDAQEKAAEGGARVQLKYENAVSAARAKLKKAEGDDATAQRREKALAAKVAEEQVRSQYESLRLKNGQLQLTVKQTAEMDNQIRLAKAAATQAVVLKYEAEAAAEKIRKDAEAARELANQIERAARAYETFLTRGQSEEIKLAGLREKLRVLQEGGTSGQASAAQRLEVQTDKIMAETREQRKLQKALGDDRTKTEDEITEAATKRLTVAQQTYGVELKIAKEQEGRKSGGKTPKSALDILLKEERSMDLKLDQRRALIGLTDREILLENTKYALMSKVQEQMATMDESQKAATLARIDGIAQEMAAREEQIKLMEEVEAQNKHIADTIANSFGSALTSIVDGTKSVKDAFKEMARDIIAELYQIYVVKQITGMISSAIMGPTLAGGYSPGGKTYGSGAKINAMQAANGGAFYGGNVIPFANGGVVGYPTNFGMSGGRRGLMGEAGPEAIMPLKRGANGKLGVQAEGGSGGVVIHQNFNFQANGDDSVKKIISQAAPQIAQMTKSSIISDRRRGGQMKATFG